MESLLPRVLVPEESKDLHSVDQSERVVFNTAIQISKVIVIVDIKRVHIGSGLVEKLMLNVRRAVLHLIYLALSKTFKNFFKNHNSRQLIFIFCNLFSLDLRQPNNLLIFFSLYLLCCQIIHIFVFCRKGVDLVDNQQTLDSLSHVSLFDLC